MTAIVCFGDSNTWGTVPCESRRYDENERWPGILKHLLHNAGVAAEVIEEGQQGRTLVHNNPFQGEKSGQRYLKDCIERYMPSLVIILLGTNDLKKRFSLSAKAIAKSAAELVTKVQQTNSQVLLIAPPPIHEVGFYAKMYQGGAAKSLELAKYYERHAQQLGCAFFDAGSVIASCSQEGIHWEADQHQCLADALAPLVKELL